MANPQKPLVVLYVSPNAELGGAERVLLNMVRYHDRTRVTPLVCLLRDGPLVGSLSAREVPFWVIAAGRFRNWRATWRTTSAIRELIRSRSVDIVHGVMAMGHLYGTLARWGTGARGVWFQHDNARHRTAIDRLAALAPSSLIIANSQDTASVQASLANWTGGIRVIHCGVDLNEFGPHRASRGDALRAELGVGRGTVVVGMVGRFQRWKGQHVFLEAVARLRPQFPGTIFWLVGDTLFGLEPEYRHSLEGQVKELGLTQSVHFLGFQADMPSVYAAMDIVVHASINPEPLGLVILEGMAMARPVVVADAGGPREIVQDSETGLRYPPGDSGALAERIACLLEDPGLRTRMGELGRKAVEERFSMDRMIREVECAYAEVMKTA
jgi:glycosyltransferase involved in cell wall biosynthesis